MKRFIGMLYFQMGLRGGEMVLDVFSPSPRETQNYLLLNVFIQQKNIIRLCTGANSD